MASSSLIVAVVLCCAVESPTELAAAISCSIMVPPWSFSFLTGAARRPSNSGAESSQLILVLGRPGAGPATGSDADIAGMGGIEGTAAGPTPEASAALAV